MTIRLTLTRALVAVLALVVTAPLVPNVLLDEPQAQALAQDSGKKGQKKNDGKKSPEPQECDPGGSGKKSQRADDADGDKPGGGKGDSNGGNCPPPEPEPEQVSLANLVTPAPAAVDAELRAALTAVGFIDTWYDTTTTHPALSLLVVRGVRAEESRQDLLNLVDDIVRTTKRSTALYRKSEEAVIERRVVIDDIGLVEEEITALEADLDAAKAILAGLQQDLALVIKVLQETAVGLYISDEPTGITAMDDVENYNDQQELSIRVDLTIDELLAQRDALDEAIANQA
ncbi:MAG: hypothetical protein ACR2PK_19585, partial [Acidimicrobiales bacterium]